MVGVLVRRRGVLLNWGDGTPPPLTNSIPEPTAMAVLAGLLPWVVRRR